MQVMRILLVLLVITVAVLVYLLITMRENAAQRRADQAKISFIYKRMYESDWVRQMTAAIEENRAGIQTALVQRHGIEIPGVYRYSIDTATTRLFEPAEMLVASYILYAALADERFLPPAQNRDGDWEIKLNTRPTAPLNDPY